ncbi:MAG: hypothetical protein Q7S57_00810 [bacterium]|nr:hypothetical protein [bacterium]
MLRFVRALSGVVFLIEALVFAVQGCCFVVDAAMSTFWSTGLKFIHTDLFVAWFGFGAFGVLVPSMIVFILASCVLSETRATQPK